MSLALRFTRRFCMAHRLASGASAKCATPHGHNEQVSVELEPKAPATLDGAKNMVAEFAAAKRRWHRWIDERVDHALQLGAEDPFLAVVRERFPEWNVMVTPGDPTTELLAVLFMAKCQAFLDAEGLPLRCRRVTLQETPTNAVVFEGVPREALPTGLDGWWWRADESIA